MFCFLIRMTNGSTKLKITFSSSEGDSSHERWVYSNLHDFVRHEVTEWDAASLGTWIFFATLPARMLLTAFSSLVHFPLGVGPGAFSAENSWHWEFLLLVDQSWASLTPPQEVEADTSVQSGLLPIEDLFWGEWGRGTFMSGGDLFLADRVWWVLRVRTTSALLLNVWLFVRQSLIFVCGFQDFYEGWVMNPWTLLTNWTTLGK